MDKLAMLIQQTGELLVTVFYAVIFGAVLAMILEFTMGDIWDNYFKQQDIYMQEIIRESQADYSSELGCKDDYYGCF